MFVVLGIFIDLFGREVRSFLILTRWFSKCGSYRGKKEQEDGGAHR